HHMYLTGMGTSVSTFFQTTTVLISVPSVILITSLLISLWGGSIRFNSAMLFATAFIPMFGIGGLTGLPLAFNNMVLHLHDTYYVIGHFHYVVAPGSVFALFAGVYHWFPKHTGRMMSEKLGQWHFWPSLIFMNGIFMPMFFQGMAGFHRRAFDGGRAYEQISSQLFMPGDSFFGGLFNFFFGRAAGTDVHMIDLNLIMSASAWLLALAQIPFIINIFLSVVKGKKVTSDNPWHATTLEWATPTPPPHGNFLTEPVAYRSAYEYSVPGAKEDFLPQFEPGQGGSEAPKPDQTPAHH
ncbi:MAG: cbb3-type cytochrome c oxidase subunit I, partial [Verrucomicrobiae bacterium]|nr:cbb3-type cytochrome c oxidase subunit I [Verrucomicrobiae bacterium]